ncbi:MAG: uncharacterized protein QOH13_2663 [Thermoleophilaceae bacterium]|nr:uncharacterized protein [Thermoleophilaceae bacterium]
MLILLALAAFGVLTGMLSGLLGVGGGIFMVPFLVLVVGLSQHQAQATSLLVVLPTAVVASWLLHRRGVGNLRVALRMGAIGMIGSIGGTFLALSLPGSVLRVIFAALMVVVGLRLLRDAARPAPDVRP